MPAWVAITGAVVLVGLPVAAVAVWAARKIGMWA